MEIPLAPETERLIDEQVRSGKYHSAAELVDDGIRLVLEEQTELEEELEALARELRIGLDEFARGEGIPAERAVDLMRRWREEVDF
jgi:antitoxin ParD1/3/4